MLWTIHQQRDATIAGIGTMLDNVGKLSEAVAKQGGVVQRQFDGKERFAKKLLFEAYAYRSIGKRMEVLRNSVRDAESDEAVANAAQTNGAALRAEFDRIDSMLTSAGHQVMQPLQQATDNLLATAKGNLGPAEKAQALRIATSAFMRPQGDLAADVTKKSSEAADRFVEMEGEVSTLRDLLSQIDMSLQLVNALRLDTERFLGRPSDDTRTVVMNDINSLKAAAGKVSVLNGANAATRDFGPKVDAIADQLVDATTKMLAIGDQWAQARTAATATLTAGMAGLKNFVAQAQEVGKEDSERSAHMSVIAMAVGTLLAIAGGLMLVETLRGPLRRVTDVMKRLADGDLEVGIDGRERGDEIGDMVRSVSVFRDAARENVRLEQEAAMAREASAAESERRAAERARVAGEQQAALAALGSVLDRLAEGDLERTMDDNLAEDFVDMAQTYNRAVEACVQRCPKCGLLPTRSMAVPAIWRHRPTIWRAARNSRRQRWKKVQVPFAI